MSEKSSIFARSLRAGSKNKDIWQTNYVTTGVKIVLVSFCDIHRPMSGTRPRHKIAKKAEKENYYNE